MTRFHRPCLLILSVFLWSCSGGKGGGSSSGGSTSTGGGTSSTSGTTSSAAGITDGGACSPPSTKKCANGRTQAYCQSNGTWELRNCSGPGGCSGTQCDRHAVATGSPCDSLDTGDACDLGGLNQLHCDQGSGTWVQTCYCGTLGCSSQTGQCVGGCAGSSSSSGSTGSSSGTTSGSSGTSGGGECSSPADCPYDNPGCANGLCGFCNTDQDCPANETCDQATGECHCSGDNGCGGDAPTCLHPGDAGVCGCHAVSGCGNGTVCDVINYGNGACVTNCLSDAGLCGGSSPYCEDAGYLSGLCLACRSNADCSNVSKPFCTVNGCAACTTDTQCQALNAGTPYCFGSGCGQCRTSSDCPSNEPCDTITHQCGTCTANGDCPLGKVCYQGACYAADGGLPDAGTSCGQFHCAASQVCDTSNSTCVQCLQDQDCPYIDSPHCDTNSSDPNYQTCVQCLSPSDCPYSNPGCSGNYCGQCGTSADCPGGQSCVSGYCECGSDSQCGGDAPTCIVTDAGSACGCSATSDCTGGTVCDKVDNPIGVCVPSCLTDAGSCNPNGYYPTCDTNSGDANYKLCVACTTNAQCVAGGLGKFCQNQEACVDCRSNSDCTSSTAPKCTSFGACVQCLSYSDCTGGQACNSITNVCGTRCYADSDCPSGTCLSDGGCG